MVARPGTVQTSWNAAELSPDVFGRSDIKQTYAGASLMQNAEPVPQGGFIGMAGTVETAVARGALVEVSLTPAFAMGPHSAAGAIIATASLSSAQPIELIDLNGLSCTAQLDAALQVQVLVAGVWQDFGVPVWLRTTAQNRRVGIPAGSGVAASAVRLKLIVTPGAPVTFTLASLQAFTANAANLTAREFEYSFSTADAFTVLVTPGNADVFKGDAYIASVAIPATAAIIPELTYVQRLDGIFFFHQTMAPLRVARDRANSDWFCIQAPFVNVPNVDYGGTYANIINDVWRITITWSQGPIGLILDLTVNGESIAGVELKNNSGVPNWSLFTSDLQAAIEALPSVNAGTSIVQSIGSLNATFTVTFSGAGNAGARFVVVPRIVNVTWAAANANNTTLGDPGGEPIMSVTRGWPSAGMFYQDRLYLGGFKSNGYAVAGSLTGEYFDLNTKVEAATGGVLFRLDADDNERILHMRQDRHFCIFTDRGEYYISDRAIVRGTPPNTVQSSRNGAAPGFRPVQSEEALIYIGASRAIVYAATYDDVSQKYKSDPISLLANHLCQNLVHGALQKASGSTSADRLFMVRDDGLMVVAVLIRNQEVNGFVRWVTDGATRNVCVDAANVAYLLVERQIAGVPRIVRERMDPSQWLHQAKHVVLGAPGKIVTGLSTLEGRSVWAVADGYPEGPYTVTGGQITLVNASTDIWVGSWTPPRVKSLPLPRLVNDRVQLARPVRVHTVRARLLGSTSLAIGANNGKPRNVPLFRAGDAGDQPVQPVTREITVTGLAGWSTEGIVEFTQVMPGAFRIRDTEIEART